MNKVLILVEGATEEAFINYALSPHLSQYKVFPQPIIIRTRPSDEGRPPFKGGHTTWAKIKKFLTGLLNDSSASLVTTMLDYYGRPDDLPGNQTLPQGSCFMRVKHLEDACQQDIQHRRFLSYFSLHEFEALLFSAPEQIARRFPPPDRAQELAADKSQFNSPEEINDSSATCPARRIEKVYPQYRKRIDGPIIAQNIGLPLIRNQCRHFDEWVNKLESIGGKLSRP